MVHDQHVFTHGMYLPFCFLCPAQSLLCVYLVWVHSQCSLEVLLYFFQLFRCRNLALNRVFSYFLVEGMFYTCGVFGHPQFIHPHTFVHPPYICMPPGVYTPPIGPHALLCTCMVLEHLHVVWGCYLLKCVLGQLLTPPLFGGASPLITPPHFIVGSLCIILRDIGFLCRPFPFY